MGRATLPSARTLNTVDEAQRSRVTSVLGDLRAPLHPLDGPPSRSLHTR